MTKTNELQGYILIVDEDIYLFHDNGKIKLLHEDGIAVNYEFSKPSKLGTKVVPMSYENILKNKGKLIGSYARVTPSIKHAAETIEAYQKGFDSL
ncbi:hypothetical protein CIL05_12700 [Virgibacillus profundi]|uniref:Uncharacterized protein n=1 Tax=Virgibacillus profundi TaxID=2024555 RepID=A0A2A2IBZ3_9BACI|nr:hypothetical protein [Virgibacillus profundi]PAV29249.1 hypothetical protein CIL05_12700 [Virgibacillus profundi]PXY53418.1 hypothetical protein CIT14_12825 [Virgibacillus profundi]